MIQHCKKNLTRKSRASQADLQNAYLGNALPFEIDQRRGPCTRSDDHAVCKVLGAVLGDNADAVRALVDHWSTECS